ncbi:MAG: CehA/McbA family metallohydrolase [Candidatus Brocadiia bacterium]
MKRVLWPTLTLLLAVLLAPPASAAELITLSPENYDEYRPDGKEAEGIFGDYVLRNDHLVAVIGNPDLVSGRSSGRWGKHQVKGALLDLTSRSSNNDQLNAFWPGPLVHRPDAPQKQKHFPDEALTWKRPGREPKMGKRVTLEIPPYEIESGKFLKDLAELPASRRPKTRIYVKLNYTLADGWDHLLVEALYKNPTKKAVRLQPAAMLRVDGTWKSNLALSGRFFWTYNKWWQQAYGILADGHLLQLQKGGREYRLRYTAAEGDKTAIPPGGQLRVVRKLFAGQNLFEIKSAAARRLGRPLRNVSVSVKDANGPVARADITALIDSQSYASGRTGRGGKLKINLPTERCVLQIKAIGRPAKTITLPAKGPQKVSIKLAPPSYIAAEISDPDGKPIPCKVQFLGKDGTPDPFFFPKTGARLVRNTVYSRTGRFRQAIAPGNYRVLVTHGPEYNVIARDLAPGRGKTKVLKGTLTRTVDTTGWISADFHNHSTVSAETNLFYVYPYSWNPGVDGDSSASQRGRVLNLLCEGIEFAPPTEHNTVSSYAPHLKALAAENLLATCPGIGLSAGRRHTLTHQNAFPVPYQPGRQDGGAIQRPEHCRQITWLRDWPGGNDMLIQVNVPRGEKVKVRREMDVLDVENLAPLFVEKINPKDQNRILEWIDILNKGYRLPGVVGSGAFDNYHGSGGVRNYVKSPTDDPAQIKSSDIVSAARRGNLIMTTGPFITAEAKATANGKNTSAPIGGGLSSDDGNVQLHVKVQAPKRIKIDRVMILANGKKRSDLGFRHDGSDKSFHEGSPPFKRTLKLDLEGNAHIIVAVQGNGPNLRRRSADGPETMNHYAVANPIYVDVGGDGFQPHSPFNDKCRCVLSWRRKPLAKEEAKPGIVRATIWNRGKKVNRDTISLQSEPPDCIEVLGEKQKRYTVGPGGEANVDFHVRFTDEWLKKGMPAITYSYIFHRNPRIRVPRSPVGEGRKAAALRIKCNHHAEQLPPVRSVEEIPKILKDQIQYPLWRRNQRFGTVRFAIAGEKLALHANIQDVSPQRHNKVRESSSVEVFAAERGKPIGQIFLLPKIGDQAAEARQQVNGKVVPAPGVKLHSTPTQQGYELVGVIPFSVLPIDPADRVMMMEFRVRTHRRKGTLRHGTVFQSGAPDRDYLQFGTIRVADRVNAGINVLNPPHANRKGRPGKMRITLQNRSDKQASDELTLGALPEGAIEIIGEKVRHYTVGPGARTDIEFDFWIADDFSGNCFELHIPRSPRYEIVRSPRLKLAALAQKPIRLTSVPDLGDVSETLAGYYQYKIRSGSGHEMARLRFAVVSDQLVLHARVEDPKIRRHKTVWKGSCLEAFGALPDEDKIGQVFLAPASGKTEAAGFQATKLGIVAAEEITVETRPTEKGYELAALIPLRMLALDSAKDAVRCEFQLTVSRDSRGKDVLRSTLFGSKLAYNNTSEYALVFIGKPRPEKD